MNAHPTVAYGLDIGVYNTGTKGQILMSTTAAWARASEGTASFSELRHTGNSSSGRLVNESRAQTFHCGRSLEGLAHSIAEDIKNNFRVALGFEAPMWIPLERKHRAMMTLFGPRFVAEKGSEWYLQSGAAATLKALSLGVLLRELLRQELNGPLPSMTTNLHEQSTADFTLFEAFVVGPYKVCGASARDEMDALIAALAFGATVFGYELPPGISATMLHPAGVRGEDCLSIWSTVFPGHAIVGAPDCAVFALESTVLEPGY